MLNLKDIISKQFENSKKLLSNINKDSFVEVIKSDEFNETIFIGGFFVSVAALTSYIFGDETTAILSAISALIITSTYSYFLGKREDTGKWFLFSKVKNEIINDFEETNLAVSNNSVILEDNNDRCVEKIVSEFDKKIKVNSKNKKNNDISLFEKTKFLKDALAEYTYPKTNDKIHIGVIGYNDEAPTVKVYKIIPLNSEYANVNIEEYLKKGGDFKALIKKGVDLETISNLGNNLSRDLNLPKGSQLQIDSNIGNGMAAIYIPKDKRDWIYTSDYLDDVEKSDMILPMFLGVGLDCKPVFNDLIDAPHVIIGGTSRSGKSIGILSILIGMAYARSPDLLNFTLLDPKRVSLQLLNDLPHVKTKTITDMDLALDALNLLVAEMESRYKLFEKHCVQDIQEYNVKFKDKLPYQVIVAEEFSAIVKNKNTMYDDEGKATKKTMGNTIEDICSYLTRAGRAAGLHCLFLTQRFSADLFDGELRDNTDMGICFKVGSATSSKMIVGFSGGQLLLGKGDALVNLHGVDSPVRVQFGGFKDKSDEIRELAKRIKNKWDTSKTEIITNEVLSIEKEVII